MAQTSQEQLTKGEKDGKWRAVGLQIADSVTRLEVLMPRLGKQKPEHLNVRLPQVEMEILRRYCQQTQRSQSDVIREFIRSLNTTTTTADQPGT